MVSTILNKRSSTAGNRPTDSDLSLGELAINTHDGVVFFKQSKDGAVSIRELENSSKAENVFYLKSLIPSKRNLYSLFNFIYKH